VEREEQIFVFSLPLSGFSGTFFVGAPGRLKRTDGSGVERCWRGEVVECSCYLNHVSWGRGRGNSRNGTGVKVLRLEYQSREFREGNGSGGFEL
jgi:hypothetical protein